MAVLPFRPTPFFANKNQAFWRLQAVGWAGALLLRAMSTLWLGVATIKDKRRRASEPDPDRTCSPADRPSKGSLRATTERP